MKFDRERAFNTSTRQRIESHAKRLNPSARRPAGSPSSGSNARSEVAPRKRAPISYTWLGGTKPAFLETSPAHQPGVPHKKQGIFARIGAAIRRSFGRGS